MEIEFSQAQAQKVLRQRNLLAISTALLSAVSVAAIWFGASRDREVVLQPVLGREVTISSARVDRDYLEAVTRDAAVLMLNRSPQGLDYWMEQVLRLAHPSAYGKLKGDLLKIANDQRGSSVTQFFTAESMQVDPKGLTSQITGVLHTMVGREEVSAVRRTFRFQWTYTGIELRMIGFGALAAEGQSAPGVSPTDSGAADEQAQERSAGA